MTTKFEILSKRRINRAKKKSRLKRRAQAHHKQRKGAAEIVDRAPEVAASVPTTVPDEEQPADETPA